MSRGDEQLANVIATRFALQHEIWEMYGKKAIQAAKRRLCWKCAVFSCVLLPICLDGQDCPYFEEKEVEG